MHPMRRLIALSEAKRPKAMSHEERVQQEELRKAQELTKAKEEAAKLLSRVKEVSLQVARSEYSIYNKWSSEWADEARKAIRETHQKYFDAAKEEHNYNLEDNPNAIMPKISFLDSLMEGVAAWWDRKKESLDFGEGEYRWDEYLDAHPKVEASDDLSRLDAEKEFLSRIRLRGGGFGSIPEMEKALDAISINVDGLNRHTDNGWSHPGTVATQIVMCGIPLILMFAKSIEAAKT